MNLPTYDDWLTRDFERAHDRALRLETQAERKADEIRRCSADLADAVAEWADEHLEAWEHALWLAANTGHLQALDRCIEQAIQHMATRLTVEEVEHPQQ